MPKVAEIKRSFKKEEYYGWRCSENMVEQYLAGCLAASSYDGVFKNFKQQSSYGYILEHVPGALGGDYLLNVEENNFDLLKGIQKFLINDLHGNPEKSTYIMHKLDDIRLLMSPTTARYIKVLSDLKTLFGPLDNMNIVEIGAGYGGLPLVVSKQYNFKNYYDVDLHGPAQLALRYCKKEHSLNNFHVLTPDQLEFLDDIKIDLVISNYAFSECNYDTQDVYIDKILSKSKRGYITHNNSAERRDRTKSIIKDYPNFKVFDVDLCKKQHPIFTWGADE